VNKRDRTTLAALRSACDVAIRGGWNDGYVRPLDCGGANGSHHSATLAKLVRLGLAERRQRSIWQPLRGSWSYRITDAGRATLVAGAEVEG
jgi:hypothetical protein